MTPFYGKSGAFNYSTNIFYDYRVPSAILDTLGREDGDRKRKTSLCSHGFTLTSAWMICGQLEPLSDPSSLLFLHPSPSPEHHYTVVMMVDNRGLLCVRSSAWSIQNT